MLAGTTPLGHDDDLPETPLGSDHFSKDDIVHPTPKPRRMA